jgi:hypothetical protein
MEVQHTTDLHTRQVVAQVGIAVGLGEKPLQVTVLGVDIRLLVDIMIPTLDHQRIAAILIEGMIVTLLEIILTKVDTEDLLILATLPEDIILKNIGILGKETMVEVVPAVEEDHLHQQRAVHLPGLPREVLLPEERV